MSNNLKNVFSEVYAFLNVLEDEYKRKVSKDIFEIIEKNRNYNYMPVYDIKRPINQQQISEDALLIITLINFNYWAGAEEKRKIKKILKLL